MNDISLKIVDSPKGLEEPLKEVVEGEVDPLALEEEARAKEPAEKPAPCDDVAKDAASLPPDDGLEFASQMEKVKEDLLKEDTSSIPSVTEEPVQSEPQEPVNDIAPSTEPVEPTQGTQEVAPVSQEITPVSEEVAPVNQLDSDQPVVQVESESKSSSPPKVPEPEAQKPEPIVESPKIEVEKEKIEDHKIIEEKQVKEEIKQKTVEETEVNTPEKNPTIPSSKISTPEVAEEKKEVPRTVKEVESRKEEKLEKPTEPDVEMVEVPQVVEKIEVPEDVKTEVVEKVEPKEVKPAHPVNGDVAKDDQPMKRRASDDVDTDSPLKKLCQEVEKTFPQHDTMINDYIQTATKNNIDEIQRHTEQLLAEIQTLRELAQKKEHEWNNILHLKKVKEEILLRLLRRKQVLSFEKSADVNGSDRTDPFDYLNQAKNLAIDKSDEISGLAIKQPGSASPMIQTPVMPVTTHFNPMSGLPPPYDKAAHMNMPKPVFPQQMMMPGPLPGFPRDMNGQLPNFGMPMGRQGPTKDVKSIIADYRQRNPDITPRRGRRMKSLLNPNMMNAPRPIAPKMDNMNNLNNLNMLFNNLDMNQKAMLERLQQIQQGGLPNSIFKDALVQFANMQQASSGLIPTRPTETVTNRPEHHKERRRAERNHEEHKQPERLPSNSPRLPPPPPYPEISLLPVTTSQETQAQQQNSLLHGILTKQAPQSFSPTLAKLLTSPERKQSATAPQPVLPSFGQAKNCGEITITPVQPTPAAPEPQPEKTEEVVQLDDEESPMSEASASPAGSGSGRLVIDEGGEGGEAPLCQGCRQRDAQFVCAGCANQWYCSRDCQVAAWDEHSEMCSG